MSEKPYFELSKKVLLNQYNIVSSIADKVSYSLKTNPEVGEMLEKLTDCMFSVHSTDFIQRVNDKSRVLFFAQGINDDDLNYLLGVRVRSFVVDNEADLEVLLRNLGDIKITLFLRMKLKEHTIHTGKHFVFGMSSDKIRELIPSLRKNKSIEKLGIHFHRKTMNISEWDYRDELNNSIGDLIREVDFINIGGGLPVRYKNYSVDNMPLILEKIKDTRRWLNNMGVKMIIEPGRFIAAPCIRLVAHIKNIYENNIILDCSVYNAAMDTFAANTRLEVEGELESGKQYTIKGCTPDSLDIFRYKVFLDNPKVGDKIIFLNAGAYNYSTDFCNLEKLKTYYVE